MIENMKTFSILIPTWNNLPYLKVCVESIRKHSAIVHQIVLHINEGIDGTLDWAKEQNITFTYSEQNIGICKAINNAASKANSDYILYLNDDMYVLPDWDVVLWNEITAIGNDYFYLSSTMIEPRQGNNRCVISPFDMGDLERGFKEEALLQSFRNLQKQDWSGSAWPPSLVHKNLWNAVGGYSEEFSPGYYSDPDFAMKLWKKGVRYFKGLSASRVYHFQSKSLGRIKLNNGRRQFKKKWGITASWFYKYCLRMGQDWKGPQKTPSKNWHYWWNKIKAFVA